MANAPRLHRLQKAVTTENLECYETLVGGQDRYSETVHAELLSMSATTTNRYFKPTKDAHRLRGIATTKPSPLLRSAIRIRKAGHEIETRPGFFEGDTVAHCGPTNRGQFARTLNLTDVFTGWAIRSTGNNASRHIICGLDTCVDALPIPMEGVGFGDVSESMNYDVLAWT